MYYQTYLSTREHRQGRPCLCKQTMNTNPLSEDMIIRCEQRLIPGDMIIVNVGRLKNHVPTYMGIPDNVSVLVIKELGGSMYGGLILVDDYKEKIKEYKKRRVMI